MFESLKKAQFLLEMENPAARNRALVAVAEAIDGFRPKILEANNIDQEIARKNGMKDALLDRLRLNDSRIDAMISGIKTVAELPDPVGKVRAGWTLPNGLFVEQISVPIGVVAIIYESRPNVTAEAFSLCYKAGCAALLRGSSAALESNRTLVAGIHAGLERGGGIPDALKLADSGHREEIDDILQARGEVDVVLPRGGRDLIRHVVKHARIPVIETGEGNCHIYVEKSADMDSALSIIENAKVQKPGACNAVETILIDRAIVPVFMPKLAARLAGTVELRCDSFSREHIGPIPEHLIVSDAVEEDWETEFLDYILAVKTVDSLDEAITHINRYGTKHSEAILTNDLNAAGIFYKSIDAACIYLNASTRFSDGGEFGFGAELGISTQKLHARGPMGLDALTTIKYQITGSGQIRL
ncbi:gamma-glutamyl phosphate reductase [Spirochaetia bacterium]|nr:gamma-glutamyl phosphate reductase [Spirochaetia bacterium]